MTNLKLKAALGASALAFATQAAAQITFYEGEGFRGRTFATSQSVGDFSRTGFNDQASSVVVDRGSREVCGDARFEGRCVVLRRARDVATVGGAIAGGAIGSNVIAVNPKGEPRG